MLTASVTDYVSWKRTSRTLQAFFGGEMPFIWEQRALFCVMRSKPRHPYGEAFGGGFPCHLARQPGARECQQPPLQQQ